MNSVTAILDGRSLNKLSKALEKYSKKFPTTVDLFVQKLANEGVNRAINYMSNHIDTGETIESVRAEKQSDGSTSILVDGAATWLEFGTGVTKNSGSYPLPLPQGIVGIGQYGKGHGASKSGWYYKDPKTGKRRHTFGIQATHFMYNTSRDLQDPSVLQGIADEVFK